MAKQKYNDRASKKRKGGTSRKIKVVTYQLGLNMLWWLGQETVTHQI